MFTSVKGKIDGEAVLYGTITMAGGLSDSLVGELPAGTVHYPKEAHAAPRRMETHSLSPPLGITIFWPDRGVELFLIEVQCVEGDGIYLHCALKTGILSQKLLTWSELQDLSWEGTRQRDAVIAAENRWRARSVWRNNL